MEKLEKTLSKFLNIFGLSGGTKNSATLERFQGHWVDLNSQCTLDVDGDQMTVTMGNHKENYTITIDSSDELYVLRNADGSGGFDMMSELVERVHEHLEGGDLIIDEKGHSYVFVREEVKKEELKIKDYSTDLPKTIQSQVITEFCLSFTNKGQYNLSDNWPKAGYNWEIERNDEGCWICDYRESYDSMMGRSYQGEVSQQFMEDLANCLKKAGIIEHNGYFMANNVDVPGYWLHVIYESGEELRIKAKGQAASGCVFDLQTLMDKIEPLLEE